MTDKMRDDAIREAARNHAGDEYFNADRAYLLVSPYSGRIFDAGFDRGWQAAQSEQSVPVVGEVVNWEAFPSYLLDHQEGAMVTEENIQFWLAAMIKDPQYNKPTYSISAVELERLRNRVASAERDLAVAVAEGDRIMCDWQEQIRKTCAALKQRNDAEQVCYALRKDAELLRKIHLYSIDIAGYAGSPLYIEIDAAIVRAAAAIGEGMK